MKVDLGNSVSATVSDTTKTGGSSPTSESDWKPVIASVRLEMDRYRLDVTEHSGGTPGAYWEVLDTEGGPRIIATGCAPTVRVAKQCAIIFARAWTEIHALDGTVGH